MNSETNECSMEMEILELDRRLDMAVDFVGLGQDVNGNCPQCNNTCIANCNNNCGGNCTGACGC
jgi:hypothetical protein